MATKKRKAPDDEVTAIRDASTGHEAIVLTTPTPTTTGAHAFDHPGPDTSLYRPDHYYSTLYLSDPSFRDLGRQDADFAPFIKANGHLDFSNPAAVMQLTKSLLKAHFGLKIELPDDRLCPPVPNRHNYILWLKKLLDTSSYQRPGRQLCGLDIGTGASCIYPLLATAQRPWCFLATDIDEKSLGYARKNVELNGLESRIRVVERNPTDSLIPLDDLGIQSIDFVMMNPPFYTSHAEMIETAQIKARPPHSACSGADVEMICSGGEVAHIGRMLHESLVLRERIQWYTSMVGKLASLETLVEQLRENNIDNYAVTEFIQGNKTKRWALGWSFGPMRPDGCAARAIQATIWKKVLPPAARMDLLHLPRPSEVGTVTKRITEFVGQLEMISWEWDAQALKGVGRARENVWGRAWRRKKKQRETAVGPTGETVATSSTASQLAANAPESEECRLGFEVLVELGIAGTSVILRWREGHEMALFESLARTLQNNLKDLAG